MKQIELNSKVDEFIKNESRWSNEFQKLREIILECNLEENFKWSKPCYTLDNKNILLIHGFKDYCAILFIKGSLLKDYKNILIQQTENVQKGRQIRFNSIKDIMRLEDDIKKYIIDAIVIEKEGLEVPLKTTKEYLLPRELKDAFAESTKFKNSFDRLTEGRQHAYILKFSEPKLSKTRIAKIKKYKSHIIEGKGLNDK